MTSPVNLFKAYFAFAVLVALTGCASLNPVAKAETLEQRAYALYGTFVVFEEQAASLVQSSEIPDSIKEALRSADRAAKPLADSLLAAAREMLEVRRALSAGTSTEEKLRIANENLLAWYSQAVPKINELVTAVKGVR